MIYRTILPFSVEEIYNTKKDEYHRVFTSNGDHNELSTALSLSVAEIEKWNIFVDSLICNTDREGLIRACNTGKLETIDIYFSDKIKTNDIFLISEFGLYCTCWWDNRVSSSIKILTQSEYTVRDIIM